MAGMAGSGEAGHGREDLIEAILEVVGSSYETDSLDALAHMRDFLSGLDRATLRSIAYQKGVFDRPPEPDSESEA